VNNKRKVFSSVLIALAAGATIKLPISANTYEPNVNEVQNQDDISNFSVQRESVSSRGATYKVDYTQENY